MDNSSSIMVSAGIVPPSPSAPPPLSQRSQPPPTTALRLGLRRPGRKSNSESSKSNSKSSSAREEIVAEKPPQPPTPFVCPICFDDTQTTTLALSCQHAFCSECWTSYISHKIRDESEHSISCMAEKCRVIVPDSVVQSILEKSNNTASWERYQELLVRHFVASNPNLKYCPYPSCTYTVSCPAAASKVSLASVVPTVTCGAKGGIPHRFCFGCSIDSDHRPVVCGVAKMWLKKCRDDSETANWIKSNTKECSQCQSTIEKNGGCKCVVFALCPFPMSPTMTS
jgi:ariadne-1